MPRAGHSKQKTKLPKTWPAMIPASLGLAAAALLCFSWLTQEVLERGTARFDSSVRELVHSVASPAVTAVFRFVTNLGDWAVIMFATLGLLGIFFYRGDRDHASIVLVTMIGAGILDGTLKLAFHRLRPDPFFGGAKPTTYSFPSGHALISFCFYGLIAGMISFHVKKRWQGVLAWCIAAVLIALIGLSRIYLGVHWPSDVLAGYSAAIIWMGAVRIMARRVEARRARASRL